MITDEVEILKLTAAYLSRDARFDGRFFTGVKTTGVYCRPICPARPKPENVEFYKASTDAERAGYRPCLRCRPEAAPYSPAWMGKSSVVKRALRRISDGGLADKSEAEFAEAFGMTPRHLRRLFKDEIGLTPKQIFDRQRLNFARTLVMDTFLPMTEIAYLAGFDSLRRFNDSFLKRFERNPSELRKVRACTVASCDEIAFTLSYRPPFNWESIYAALEAQALPEIEVVENGIWTRYFKDPQSQTLGKIKVANVSEKNVLEIKVSGINTKELLKLSQKLRKMFDLDSDPITLSNFFSTPPIVNDIFTKHEGLRLLTGWDAFEAALRAILGQGESVARAQVLLSQLILAYGEKIQYPKTGKEIRLFPLPQVLLNCDFRAVEIASNCKNAIRELSRLVFNGELNFDSTANFDEIRKTLSLIPGVERSTVECICLKALGDTEAFPDKDFTVERLIAAHPEIVPSLHSPYQGYLCLYLWREFESR